MPDRLAMATLTRKSARSRYAPTERLEARVPRDFKKTLKQAAAITGHTTVTSFILFALQSSARRAIEEHQQARLTAEESAGFVQNLIRPSAPNRSLRTAWTRYQGTIRAGT
jgi:uncharacterized protein (DUF1778 family)